MKKENRESIGRIAEAIKTASTKTALNIPSDARTILENIFTDRGGQLRRLSNPRKSSTDREKYVLKMINWHRGSTGGSLWGPMMAQFLVSDADERDRLDNLCMLFNAVVYGDPSRAAGLWKEAIYGDAS